jgi:uncharacterized protein
MKGREVKKEIVDIEDKLIPPCFISIDREGNWLYRGMPMIQEEIVRDFYSYMTRDSLGRYIIDRHGERCYLDVEDTAWVIWRVTYRKDSPGAETFELLLNDHTLEALSPSTLYIGEKDVLYCRVKGDLYPARFLRPAYYQLAAHIEEEEGRFFLPLNGVAYNIEMPAGQDNRKDSAFL